MLNSPLPSTILQQPRENRVCLQLPSTPSTRLVVHELIERQISNAQMLGHHHIRHFHKNIPVSLSLQFRRTLHLGRHLCLTNLRRSRHTSQRKDKEGKVEGGRGEDTHVLCAILVRPLAMRPQEDGALLQSEWFPIANRLFHGCGMYLDPHLYRPTTIFYNRYRLISQSGDSNASLSHLSILAGVLSAVYGNFLGTCKPQRKKWFYKYRNEDTLCGNHEISCTVLFTAVK